MSNHSQDQLVKELVDEVVQTLMEEHDQLVAESERLNNILAEAAATLRGSFRTIDAFLKSHEAVVHNDYRDAYQEIIAALQFEDIVSQILGHHVDRIRVSQAILGRINDVVDRAQIDRAEDSSVLCDLRADITARLNDFPGASSVMQENLAVGESELF